MRKDIVVKGLFIHLLAPPAWLVWIGLLLPPLLILYPMFGNVPSPLPSYGSNALAHIVVYAILAVPHALWLGRRLGWGLLGLLAFSAIIEVIQPAFGRGAEWADMLSNVAGMVLGVILGWALRKLLRTVSRPSASG